MITFYCTPCNTEFISEEIGDDPEDPLGGPICPICDGELSINDDDEDNDGV